MTATALKPDLYFSADISKVDPLDDGTVIVYGIPCMPGVLDNDKQMVDPAWLKTALSEWYATGPNIREMHQPIAAGVGTELDWKGDVPYVTARIVDPVAAKKVREKVLRAFSIGVKGPVTKKSRTAPNGLIVGGKIIELTICDRPCIPGSDILDFKADLCKVAGYITDDEIVDYQRGVAWKCAPLTHTSSSSPNKETTVDDTENTEKSASTDGEKTVDAATEKADGTEAEKTAEAKTETETETKTVTAAAEKAEKILAAVAEKAAKSAFCAKCDKSMEIQDPKEKTVKGNRMIVGQCEKGHSLTKYMPDDADKSADSDTEKAPEADAAKSDEAEKTVEAAEAKSPEPDTAKADEPAEKTETEEKTVEASAEKTVTPTVTNDAVMAALNTLLKSAGIDLEKVAQQTTVTRAEQLSARLAEFQTLTGEISKSAESGGTTTLTGLDAATVNRMRSCLDEINQLAAQMAPGDGLVRPGNEHQKGTVDMGTSHVAAPSDTIDLQEKAPVADLVKVATSTTGTAEHVDASELVKAMAAEVEKAFKPIHERLAEVEYSVKPASPPVLVVEERGNAFVGKQAVADAQAKLAALSDDDRAKLVAAALADQRGW